MQAISSLWQPPHTSNIETSPSSIFHFQNPTLARDSISPTLQECPPRTTNHPNGAYQIITTAKLHHEWTVAATLLLGMPLMTPGLNTCDQAQPPAAFCAVARLQLYKGSQGTTQDPSQDIPAKDLACRPSTRMHRHINLTECRVVGQR